MMPTISSKPYLMPTIIVGLTYLSYLLVIAGEAQLQLVLASSDPPSILFYAPIALFFAVPVSIASGVIPALVLRAYGVRSRAVYLINAVISAVLAAYAFSFNFGVADNLGAILLHVPKQGVPNGWVYEAPPFAATLANTFRGLGFIWQEWQFVAAVLFVALIFAAICGWLFRSFATRQPISSETA